MQGSNVGVSVVVVNAEDADIEPALRYAIVSGKNCMIQSIRFSAMPTAKTQ